MAALSGHNNLYASKLILRKPAPSHGKVNVFDAFLRSPEALAQFVNGRWTYLDEKHVPSVQALCLFVQSQNFQGIPGRDGRDGYSPDLTELQQRVEQIAAHLGL